MISEEKIAQHAADSLWNTLDYGPRHSDFGFSNFESDVISATRTEESNFKLSFYYRLQSLVSQELETHLPKCKFRETPEKCPENMFYYKAKRSLENKIKKINPNYDRQSLNTELVNKSLLSFQDFPEAAKPLNAALELFSMGGDDRMVVDNFRLAFEVLLKKKLNNNKSIENQKNDLGTLLNKSGTSPEIMNMFDKLVIGYTAYQNENVKHNDKLKRDEVEFIMNLSLTFMHFIINK